MNDQITLQELIELLAQHHQIEHTDAEKFGRTFFALIGEALATDKYVKVKGLGTFKLIDADVCENMGTDAEERIGMQNHLRISFTPDATIRDAVNKPFNHFETVLLNESTCYDDMQEVPAPQDSFTEDTSDEELGMQSDIAARHEAFIKEEPSVNKETILESNQEKKNVYLHLPWCLITFVLLAGILIGIGVAWIILSGRQYVPGSVVRTIIEQEKSAGADTLSAVAITDTLQVSSTGQEGETALPVILSDTIRYDMQGTLTTHVLRRGESLARLAEHYYGNRNLWTYLARYNRNRIKDANDIPIGTLICIPKLAPKE